MHTPEAQRSCLMTRKRKDITTVTNFPILDSPHDNTGGRVVIAEYGLLQPRIDETDWWCAMPLRLAIGDPGLVLEIGPYSLDEQEVARLQAALSAYGRAAGWIRAGTR